MLFLLYITSRNLKLRTSRSRFEMLQGFMDSGSTWAQRRILVPAKFKEKPQVVTSRWEIISSRTSTVHNVDENCTIQLKVMKRGFASEYLATCLVKNGRWRKNPIPLKQYSQTHRYPLVVGFSVVHYPESILVPSIAKFHGSPLMCWQKAAIPLHRKDQNLPGNSEDQRWQERWPVLYLLERHNTIVFDCYLLHEYPHEQWEDHSCVDTWLHRQCQWSATSEAYEC